MKNISLSVRKNVLTVRINLDEEHGHTRSGQSICIATTEGNVPIPQGGKLRPEFLNLTCFRRLPREERQW